MFLNSWFFTLLVTGGMAGVIYGVYVFLCRQLVMR